jgi:BirA family biotin operon repressor/biotin-[acetyl-CoA-carboxylase] ligase
MATFLHQGDAPLAAFAGYSLCIGVSLVSVFARYNATLQLKWPNDLVVVTNGSIRKVGGILIEVQELNGKRIVLTGIGVNLSDPPADVEHATSIKEVSGATLDAETLLPVMAQTLEENHQRFLSDGGFRAFRTQWEEASCFERGESVISIDLGFQTVSGVFDAVSDTGALQLRREGRVETFHSGHILSVERPRNLSSTSAR